MRITLLVSASLALAAVACAAADTEPSSSASAQETVSAPAAADASVGADASAADASAPALPTYGDIAPLVASHCGTCHRTSFSTLAKVKAHKDAMIEVLEGHVMPRNDPFWSDTADGQTLLDYLHESPELL